MERGHLIQRRDSGVSERSGVSHSTEVWPLPHVEFNDEPGEQCRRVDFVVWGRQWSACLSLLEAGEELKKIFN